MGSPRRLNTRPSVCRPTGTWIGPPVSTAFISRTSPSVEDIATQRTTSSPIWSATSTVRRMSCSGYSIRRAFKIGGKCSGSNRTSTVGPITWIMLPTLPPVPFVWVGSGVALVRVAFLRVAFAMVLPLFERFGPADDLDDFARDRGLAGPVHVQRERLDHLVRVLRGGAHRDHPRPVLRGGGFRERHVEPHRQDVGP